VNRGRILSFGLGAILFVGLSTVGCSSDTTPSKADAGKKDSGTDGKAGGTGGSSATGGSNGTGGSSAKGGSSGSGGSSASGGAAGSSANGGSSGSGGSTGGAAGGAAGGTAGNVGGSAGSGSGGSAGGAGGSNPTDGGPTHLDAVGTDAEDAPLTNDDSSIGGSEAGSTEAGTVLLDSAGLDVTIDTTPVQLDAELDVESLDVERLDVEKLDVEKHDLGLDVATSAIPCSTVRVVSLGDGNIPDFGTASSVCLATCDDISGWGGSNLIINGQTDRALLLINGQSVAIPNGNSSVAIPTPKYLGTYTLFQISASAGSNTYGSIYWWGTPHACSAPDGGFNL
jgi:hypothetical protein